MFAVDYVAGRSSGSPLWLELVALGLAVGAAAFLTVSLAVRWLVGRIRRSHVASASAVSAIVAAAVTGEDAELVVMRASYELRCLLGLADCRWAWLGDEIPVGALDDDGSILFGQYRWPVDRHGLPPHGVQRQLAVDGHSYGWIVLVPETADTVTTAQLRGAVTLIDVLALCLDNHRHLAIHEPGS